MSKKVIKKSKWCKEKKKKKKKKFGHWLSIYVKSKPYLFSSFRKKRIFFFCTFWAVFGWKKGFGQRPKGHSQNLTQSMFSTHFVVNWESKDFGSSTSQFLSHWSETSFQKNFILVFQVWLLTTPVYLKKEGFYQQMQNSILSRLEPIRNRKSCLPFSFSTLSLSAQFNWNKVFRNSGHFRCSRSFISSREEAKKIVGSDKIIKSFKIKAFVIIFKGKFLEGK